MGDDKKKFSELVLAERDKGNVVFLAIDAIMSSPVKDIIKQPVDGLLWDLNRDEATALTFMDREGMSHWVNNFAVALVIRELKSQVAQLEDDLKEYKEGIEVERGWKQEAYDRNATLAHETSALKRLKEYATHKPGCYENSELCICGLDALLTDKPTNPPKRTARQSGIVESFGEGLVPDYLVFTDEYGRRWRLESQFEQENDEIREHLEAFTSGLLTVEQMHLIALALLAKTETPEEKSEGGLK